ncbi:DNA repair ATPase [Streptomyces sp. NPDC005438]|uniref:DNA repair ATPase n=1 Tax=Streptomyces sp. NPDC005438 TaxID=3156880 RepID=UPI0033AD3A44
MDAGTYELLRDRLAARSRELARRAEALNERRTETFGSTRLRLAGTARMHTPQPCVPRDVAAVGGRLLFGYQTPAGLTDGTGVGDVFALHELRTEGSAPELVAAEEGTLPSLLEDSAFVREFGELHRYFAGTTLLRLRTVDGRLLAVFRTGQQAHELRVLRWQLTTDGTPRYLDARGERDHVYPPSQQVEWTAATRDDHVLGRHPHVAVGGELYVSTVGGALTVKTVNDTETAEGVHSEPVDEPLQSLADAAIEHSRIGPLLLLRVRPYNEERWRHLVFHTRTRQVLRLDGIGQACLRLPDDQGILFPGGYCLASGASKTFDAPGEELEFEGMVRSPNGEDLLYAFHDRARGGSVLLSYNVIRKDVANPISCQGYALFEDGALVALRATPDGEPSRVHTAQVWQTPYVSDTYAAAQPLGTGPLERVGNQDLVRGISDCLAVTRTVVEARPASEVFQALVDSCARITDRFHWLSDAELGDLAEPLHGVRDTAAQMVDEFTAYAELTRQAAEALETADADLTALVRRIRGESPRSADTWVAQLTELRRAQGHLVTLREMRHADTDRIDELAERAQADLDSTAQRAVEFLQRPDAFRDYHRDVERLTGQAEELGTAVEAEPLAERLDTHTEGLQVLTEIVTGLDISDATVRTAILERIAEVLGGVNRARATLAARRRELLDSEGRAEFTAEMALLSQSVTGALAAADTPEACEERLARLLLQLESLESRFSDSDEFLAELADQRADIHEAFSSRQQTLEDGRARHAERLAASAGRVLETIHRRAAGLPDVDAVHTYFASDPMVGKVRRTAEELRGLGDTVRAEELEGRIKAARQEAGRALRDRSDLYGEGGATLRLGRHRFAVTTQSLDLTLVPYEDRLAFALTGTDYRSPVDDPEFEGTREYWDRHLPSESPAVYRAEHLAARLLDEHGARALREADLPELVRRAAEAAYDEGYERGVHDQDTVAVLEALLRLHQDAGLLRHPPAVRAAAQLLWSYGVPEAERDHWARRARSLSQAGRAFGHGPALDGPRSELAALAREFGTDAELADPVAAYLVRELAEEPEGFVLSAGARGLLDKFHQAVADTGYREDLAATEGLAARRQLAEGWLGAYREASGEQGPPGDLAEAVAVELCPELPRYEVDAPLSTTVRGLLGTHPRVRERQLTVRLDELLARTERFRSVEVPGFRAYQKRRNALVAAERDRLRLSEYRPRVMGSFVRNRLLDEVYLPLVGDNLAKQLGAAGDGKRVDSNGLLLLISPPGYGKTTLMEYVADRLGLLFVKVNGPALGHQVTSLDPAEAPNATARQEVEKINFALEAGNNVLLHLDDIQHTSPELLQRFISLCDAQRRMEGVWNGRTRTYDLRGKRFAVSMGGNPYTESGQRFRIPDMLANRADVWNLGDVLTGKEDAFALSFVENALTSHPVLAPLASRERADLELLLRMAEGDESARSEELSHPYGQAELDKVLAVLRHLRTARDTVLTVNRAYIASAAQSAGSRTEPPFQLQGSYRDMNKITERISPAMNEAELSAAIDDHYTSEAQTLTTGAEANLLKLAELRGRLHGADAERWAEVKRAYVRTQTLGGAEDDPATRAVAALGLLADRIAAIETAINRVTRTPAHGNGRHASRSAPGGEPEPDGHHGSWSNSADHQGS